MLTTQTIDMETINKLWRKCQFLIGTIQTYHFPVPNGSPPMMFQFLIGTIQTSGANDSTAYAPCAFQFLIGTIQTFRATSSASAGAAACFNSS